MKSSRDDFGDNYMRPDSVETLRHDLNGHSRTITALTTEMTELKKVLSQLETDREVRKERDRNLNDRLGRIETSIGGLNSTGKYILFAFLSTFIGAVVTFVIRGGLNVPS